MARSSSHKLKRWVTPVGVPCCAIIVDENLAIIVETLQIPNMMKNITRLTLAIGDANWQRECRTTEKGTCLVNPYQSFTSPKPAFVAVTKCWRCHFISASGRVLNMVLKITAISMRHSTYEARAYRNYRWQDSLSQPMEASVTLDTLTIAA